MHEPLATASLRGPANMFVRQFEVVVIDGPDRGMRAASTGDELTIGTSTGNDLQLTDPAVSRHHCVVQITPRGLALRDLSSTNGTLISGIEIERAVIPTGTVIRAGASSIKIELLAGSIAQPLAGDVTFASLVGESQAMRRLYATIERAAPTAATVLIEGETGTGKELIAETVHELSPRRRRPLVVVDCAALPAGLIESELFGHVRGAFTGGDTARIGAFESAQGGTVFLDEIGELPLALQPVLLRVLENRTVRPIGSNEQRPVDVRVVAATHRDLRIEVNRKRFRADLYYRLNVVRLVVPPLRERPGDIPHLVRHFWRMFAGDSEAPADLVAELASKAWPGNVRELRNAVEGRVSLGAPVPAAGGSAGAATGAASSAPALSYGEAKDQATALWERSWVEQQLAAHQGNLSRTARAARMGRRHLRELARKYGLVRGSAGDDDADDDRDA